jgi:hypothetical protein
MSSGKSGARCQSKDSLAAYRNIYDAEESMCEVCTTALAVGSAAGKPVSPCKVCVSRSPAITPPAENAAALQAPAHSVILNCKGCQMNAATCGLPLDYRTGARGEARWCTGCAASHVGAVDIRQLWRI